MNRSSESGHTAPASDTSHEDAESATSKGLDVVGRRKALQRIGLAGGVASAAWAAPSVIGVFDSPAGAAAAVSALLCNNPSAGKVTVPKNRVLHFDLGGGSGGGGARGTDGANSKNGGNGGSGAQVTGTIAAMASYTLTTAVGMAGTMRLATATGPTASAREVPKTA
mgnify:CR=1 FL=1